MRVKNFTFCNLRDIIKNTFKQLAIFGLTKRENGIMSRKSDLEKAIKESENEIDLLEQKRIRSMSAFIEALVNHDTPSPEDVEYFKTFSGLIDLERENLRRLNEELDKIKK